MRKCKINIGNKDYELSMNRKSILWLENKGFNIQDVELKPMFSYCLMFQAGFINKYPEIDSESLMDQYEEEGGDIGEIVKFLIEEYVSFITALTDTKSAKKKMEII